MSDCKPSTQILDSLHQVLQEELLQADRTLEKLLRKKEALMTNQPQELARIDRDLLALNRKSKHLEQQRQTLMSELGFKNQPLEMLIQQLEPPYRTKFTLMRDQLKRALLDVAQINRESRDLLDLSIRWIHETVELIASVLTPEGASYTPKGSKQRPSSEGAPLPGQSTINHSA